MTALSAMARQTPALEIARTAVCRRWSWQVFAKIALSVGLVAAAASQLGHAGWAQIWASIPVTPIFWGALLSAYLALPFSEWLIYRRIWRLPAAGILPLLAKRVINEVVLGYSGDLYFYVWARRRLTFESAPFGVVKDVAIVSAQIGNLVSLVLVGTIWFAPKALQNIVPVWAILGLVVIILATSIPVLFFRKVFCLKGAALGWVGLIQLIRVVAGFFFATIAWHSAVPAIGWKPWILMATLRQLLSRLPLVPNKDVVFASLAIWMLDMRPGIAMAISMTATLNLVGHVAVSLVALAAAVFGVPAGGENGRKLNGCDFTR